MTTNEYAPEYYILFIILINKHNEWTRTYDFDENDW